MLAFTRASDGGPATGADAGHDDEESPMTSRHEPPPTPAEPRARRRRRSLAALLGLALVAPLAPVGAAAAGPMPAAPAPVPAAAEPTADGLRLWLPLDETEGTVAHDASGHGLDATLVGSGAGGARARA